MSSHDLLARFAEAKGLSGIAFDENGLCCFGLDGGTLALSLESDPDGTRLHATTELRRLVDEQDAVSVLGALMVVNGVYNVEGRGVFALEGDNADRIVFMRLFDAERLSEEAFLADMETFLADALEWRRRLLDPDLGMDDEPPSSGPDGPDRSGAGLRA